MNQRGYVTCKKRQERLVGMVFASGHLRHGEIETYESDRGKARLKCVEYTDDHPWHLHIKHYKGDKGKEKLVRADYASGHKHHGRIEHYKGVKGKETLARLVKPPLRNELSSTKRVRLPRHPAASPPSS